MIKGTPKNEDYLVQVSAQVMTRDDSTGGWVPVGGGGLSTVRLCKLLPLDRSSSNGGSNNNSEPVPQDKYRNKPEYIIHGERIADNAVILDCRLKKDIQYTKANPKWHHWKTDEKRYGLTFERSEDAKAFDQGIRIAVADLTGITEGLEPTDTEGIFTYMPLSLKRKDSSSRSASTTSTTTSSPGTCSPQSPNNDSFTFAHSHNHTQQRPPSVSSLTTAPQNNHSPAGSILEPPLPQQPQQFHYQAESPVSDRSSRHKSSFDSSLDPDEVWVRTSLDPSCVSGKSEQALIDCETSLSELVDSYREESYVVFNKSKAGAPHEYSYPNLEPSHKTPAQHSSTKKPTQASSSSSSVSGHTVQTYPPLPIKKSKSKSSSSSDCTEAGKQGQAGARCRLVSAQVQCKHCCELFSLDDNPRGSCDDAPDSVERCIECFTCVSCTKCLMYHCWADADGEYHHPCSCDPGDSSLCKRWTALTLLSLVLPCLWCYLPLKACHHSGTKCGLCGGRHKAA